MKKLLLLLICLTTCFLFSGCSFDGIDVQTLIEPPTSNEDQQAIHALMQGKSPEISFVYPKRGEYRSAIIMDDFNGDLNLDAFGFYSDPEGGIWLKFMTEKDGTWQSLNTFKNLGAQVDKVIIGDINGDKSNEIIVGWGSPQGLTATISVYQFINGRYEEYSLEYNYNEFILTDFNADDVLEIFTITTYTATEEEDGTDKKAFARVFGFNETPTLFYACELNESIINYTSCNFVPISKNSKAVIVEGLTAQGTILSQIICQQPTGIVALLSQESMLSKYNYFTRPSGIPISYKDINGDGIYEFPIISPQNGTENNIILNSYNYYVDWVQIDTEKGKDEFVKRTIMNTEAGFMFTVDSDRDIICKLDGSNRYAIKERVTGDSGDLIYEKQLFVVKVATAEEWAELRENSLYELLFVGNNKMYYAVLDSSATDSDIKNSIKSIN